MLEALLNYSPVSSLVFRHLNQAAKQNLRLASRQTRNWVDGSLTQLVTGSRQLFRHTSSRWTGITSLKLDDLCGTDAQTFAAVAAQLKKQAWCANIHNLEICGGSVGPAHILALGLTLPSISTLALTYLDVCDSASQWPTWCLEVWTGLTKLHVETVAADPASVVRAVGQVTSLKWLYLLTNGTPAELHHMSNLTALTYLNMGSDQPDCSAAEARELQSTLSGTLFPAWGQLQELELWINGLVSGPVLGQALNCLTSLTKLNIDRLSLAPGSVLHLPRLKHLTVGNVSAWALLGLQLPACSTWKPHDATGFTLEIDQGDEAEVRAIAAAGALIMKFLGQQGSPEITVTPSEDLQHQLGGEGRCLGAEATVRTLQAVGKVLPSDAQLKLQHMEITSQVAAALPKTTTELRFWSCQFHPGGLQALANLPHLKALHLGSPGPINLASITMFLAAVLRTRAPGVTSFSFHAPVFQEFEKLIILSELQGRRAEGVPYVEWSGRAAGIGLAN